MRGTRRVYLAIAGIHTHVPRHKIWDRFKIKASSESCRLQQLGILSTEGIKWTIQIYHRCHFRPICILPEASRVLPAHHRFGPSVDANLSLGPPILHLLQSRTIHLALFFGVIKFLATEKLSGSGVQTRESSVPAFQSRSEINRLAPGSGFLTAWERQK